VKLSKKRVLAVFTGELKIDIFTHSRNPSRMHLNPPTEQLAIESRSGYRKNDK
jgi:hypothetical protein